MVNPADVLAFQLEQLQFVNRTRREFPETDPSQIVNPRDYYLSRVLYTGDIYVHTQQSFSQLFERTKQIAENSGQPYILSQWLPKISIFKSKKE